jgi:hypothetical protein
LFLESWQLHCVLDTTTFRLKLDARGRSNN